MADNQAAADPAERRLALLTLLAFLLAFAAGAAVIVLFERANLAQKQRVAAEVAAHMAHNLEQEIHKSIHATYTLAAVLRQGKGRVDDFDTLASQMLPIYDGVSSLQLAPGGVIRHIVPLRGNEAAIGHDLLKDPKRNKEAFLAVQTRKLTLAGPFELLQGGVAVIGRLPVFLSDRQGVDQFWGFTTALIRIPDLIRGARLHEHSEGYDFELSRVHPDGGKVQVFGGTGVALPARSVSFDVDVPNGRWTLRLAPHAGWHSPLVLTIEITLALLFAIVVAALARSMLFLPLRLQQEVYERTAELAGANRKLREEIGERERAEQELLRHQEQLENAVRRRTEELSELSAHIEHVREEEKVNIARELHDEFGGVLMGLKMSLARLDENCRSKPEFCAAGLKDALGLVDTSFGIMRRILDSLRPSLLDNLGIGAAIQWQASQFSQRTGVPCEVVLYDEDARLDSATSVALFRILQEALTNISRHARAKQVTVSLSQGDGEVTLEIRDDGVGIGMRDGQVPPSHGLRGMDERVRRLGGRMRVDSQPMQGTTVEVSVPA